MEQIKKKENEVGSKLSDFEIIKELGKGSYGTVYTVKSLLNSKIYVMKKMELNHLNHRQQQECYREVSILKKVSHHNIIKYYSSFLEKEILYIIMEYAELGDLYSLIKHYKKHSKYFDEIDLWKISYEILTGLEYLHSHKIIHRDIKCLNLFITKDRHIKIGDLGVSTINSGLDNLHYTRVGTPLYISPELVKQSPYDFKTDIWSFGCSLYHLASLEPPFLGGNLIVLGNNIVKGVPKSLPIQYSNQLRFFIDKMLEKKAENRPSAKEALELIPKDIREKIKSKGEKFQIKSKRPFSSAMNKVITVNKDEIKNLFNEKKYINNKNNQDKIEIHNIQNVNTENNIKNNKNIFNNHSSGNIITIHNLEDNKNNKYKEKESKINENKSKELKALFNPNDSEKVYQKEKESEKHKKNTELIKHENVNKLISNSHNNILKKSLEICSEKHITKKAYDISFNIPSFNNQKGFNNFRINKKKTVEPLSENNKFNVFNFGNKINSNYNYLNIFSPLFKNQQLIEIKKNKIFFPHKNVIEHNKNQNNNKNFENKLNNQNYIKDIIEKNKNKEKSTETNLNMKIINNENKNVNIICLNQEDKKTINNIDINSNNEIINNNNLNIEQNVILEKKDLIRLNTDTNKNKENLKFPELNVRDKTLKNYIKKSNINAKNNFLHYYFNPSMTNISNNHYLYKRLTSAKISSRSFSSRPFTSKANKNKNPINFTNNSNSNNDTINDIIKKNKKMLYYTKDNPQSETHRNFSNIKTIDTNRTSFRPLTGIKPQINNNVMNININFYNIDMNKRFLIPEINPYYSSNEIENNNNEPLTEESLLQTKKFRDNIINNMNLKNYKNSNEFLFQKIIKAIEDIKGNSKRLTINDLK